MARTEWERETTTPSLIYFCWLSWVSASAQASLSLQRAGTPWVAELRLLTAQVSLAEERRLWGPRASAVVEGGLHSGGSQNPERRLGDSVHGLTLLQGCGIFPARDRTQVCCTGPWTLNHPTSREACQLLPFSEGRVSS